jgi:hypothetical protein
VPLLGCAGLLRQQSKQQRVTPTDLSAVYWALATLEADLPADTLQQLFALYMEPYIFEQVGVGVVGTKVQARCSRTVCCGQRQNRREVCFLLKLTIVDQFLATICRCPATSRSRSASPTPCGLL